MRRCPASSAVQDEMLSPLTAGERETLSVLLAKIVLNTFDRPAGVDDGHAAIHSDGTSA